MDLAFDLSNLTDLIDIENDELATVYRIVRELYKLDEPPDGCALVVTWSLPVLRVLTWQSSVDLDARDIHDVFERSAARIKGAVVSGVGDAAVLTVQCASES